MGRRGSDHRQVADATQRLVRISIRTGARLPVYESAQGKLFCAFLNEGEAPPIPDDLRSELDSIRGDGLSIGSDVTAGIRAVATPVFRGSRMIASLAVVGTTTAIARERDSLVATAARETAKRLSSDLGFVEENG